MIASCPNMHSLSLGAFWSMTKKANEVNLAHASQRISENVLLPPKSMRQICIIATGSDGRKEKGHASLVEPIVIHTGKLHGKIAPITLSLDHVRLWKNDPLMMRYGVEIKDLDSKDSVFSYAYNDPLRVFPQRILEGAVLFGNPELLEQARVKIIFELCGSEGPRIRDRVSSLRRTYKRDMLTGRQVWKKMEITNFDLEAGEAYYFDDKESGAMVRSFKNGPLRFVQNAVARAIVKLAGSNVLGKEMLIAELPSPTVEKIEFFRDFGLSGIPAAQLDEVTDCYLHFLRLYHESELGHKVGLTTTWFDAPAAKERINALGEILSEGIMK